MYLSLEKRAALKIANKIREDFGYDPVKKLSKGIPGRPTSCPIARTINENLDAEVGGVSIIAGGKVYFQPERARMFIKNFDSGEKHHTLSYDYDY